MNYVNKLLNKIIDNNYDFCCLCFNDIVDEPIRFADEVVLLENDCKNSVIVGEILSFLFGQEMLGYITEFNALCQQCITYAQSSYKFIKDSKQNGQYLVNVIEHLTKCFENTTEELQDTKSLFVSLNPDLCTSNQYYDNIGFVTSRSHAFKRFELLANLKVKNETSKSTNKDFRLKPTICRTKQSSGNETDSDGTTGSEEDWSDENYSIKYRCHKCNKVFTKAAYLRNHFSRLHGRESVKCSKCPRSFLNPLLLRNHMKRSHAPLICKHCGKIFNNRNTLKIHEKGHYLKLICQDCGRVYKNHNTFRKHIDNNICQMKTRHSPADAKFTCDYCQKKYSQKISLRVHIQYEHLNYKALECKWCDKKFWCKSRLDAHSVKHTKERNFICTICSGKFVTKESLLYHTRIHTGEKPYPCPHCDSRFLSASRRQAHVRTHHMDPTVECDVCHSKFSSHHYLLKHKKIHNPEINSDAIETQKSNSKNKVERPKQKRLKILPSYRNINSKSAREFEVEPIPKRIVKYYYEIDPEGNLKLQSNPEQLQFDLERKEVEIPDTSSRIEVVYQETNQQVNKLDDNNYYLEIETEDVESDYVIKVSENDEV